MGIFYKRKKSYRDGEYSVFSSGAGADISALFRKQLEAVIRVSAQNAGDGTVTYRLHLKRGGG